MTATLPEAELMEIGSAARQLGVSASLLRKLEDQHKVAPAMRPAGGRRLYSPSMVEAIRAARSATVATRQGAA